MLDETPLLIERSLWFYPNINRFTDIDGNIMHNLQPYFQTWQLEEWKKNQSYGLLTDRFGNDWDFYYLEEEEEEHLCSHRCLWCRQDCDIRILWDNWEQEQHLIKGE